jgi:hypothetical protein
MEAAYDLPFVRLNFGIAIDARIPMITTTISSSMSVKPVRRMIGEVTGSGAGSVRAL